MSNSNNKKRVTILGAGNGGQTLAFHLSMNNIDVMLWEHPKFASNIHGIVKRGGIEAVEKTINGDKEITAKLSGFAELAGVTTDIKAAMEYSDVILIIVPAFAQEQIFELAMPHLRDGQLILTLPGNLASLVFTKMMAEAGIEKDILFAEATTIPYACRIVGPGQVFILGLKDAFDIAALPANRTDEAIERLSGILQLELLPLDNILEGSFSNMNMIVHPGTASLNMGAFENRNGEFFFYKEGMSESVSKVLKKIDEERMAIGEKYNLKLRSFLEILKDWYSKEYSSIRDFAVNTPVHNSFGYDAPTSPSARYISEDTPYILVPVHELGRLAGILDPAIESIINIDSIYNEINYFEEGRNLKRLGLEGKSLSEIMKFVEAGEPVLSCL